MDFRRPPLSFGPSLEGDALRVLAGADDDFSGRQVHKLVDHGSEEGLRRALNRLVAQGIVTHRRAGQAVLYRFNRDHLAAPYIEGLVRLRAQLVERLRAEIAAWPIQPVAAAVFGSVARGEASQTSDLDLFFLRPAGIDYDAWAGQVESLALAATRWTGNDARPFELGEEEFERGADDEAVVQDVLQHGIEIAGSLRALRRRR